MIFQSTRSQRPRLPLSLQLMVICFIFQSTRSQRPRPCTMNGRTVVTIFQSTRSQRPRQLINATCYDAVLFQSTRSQRPRRKDKNSAKAQGHFNPRGRKDLDHHFLQRSLLHYLFQSTRSQRPRHGASPWKES